MSSESKIQPLALASLVIGILSLLAIGGFLFILASGADFIDRFTASLAIFGIVAPPVGAGCGLLAWWRARGKVAHAYNTWIALTGIVLGGILSVTWTACALLFFLWTAFEFRAY